MASVGFGLGQLHQVVGVSSGVRSNLFRRAATTTARLAFGGLHVRAHHLDQQRAGGYLEPVLVRLPDIAVAGVDLAVEEALDGSQHYRPVPVQEPRLIILPLVGRTGDVPGRRSRSGRAAGRESRGFRVWSTTGKAI